MRQGNRSGRGEADYAGGTGEIPGAAWDWSDQVWSGEGRFDEGRAGWGYGPRFGGRARGRYGPARYEGRYGVPRYGRGVYGQDQYGWIEYDEPRYVASLYRGERRGEEPYREHEWQRSREYPGMLARVFARGPKGYTRSDERIKEDISEHLFRAEHIDSSEVTVEVKDGVVTLSGTVPERWMRHEIEDIADDCMGVRDIENNVRVQRRTLEETILAASGAWSRGGQP